MSPTAALSDTLSELSPQSVAPPTHLTPPVTDTPLPNDTPLSLLPPDQATLPTVGITPANSATDVLLPLEVQPVLPIESPVAPIGEVLPPVGWRVETQLIPFSVMQLDGPSRPSSNLTKENAKQNDDQDTDLGNKPPAPPPPSEPEVRNNLLETFPELSRTDIDDFLDNLYRLTERSSLTGQLSPRQRRELLQGVHDLVQTGMLGLESIRAIATIHTVPPAPSVYDPVAHYRPSGTGSGRFNPDNIDVSNVQMQYGVVLPLSTPGLLQLSNLSSVVSSVEGITILRLVAIVGAGYSTGIYLTEAGDEAEAQPESRIYKDAPYHHQHSQGAKSKAPTHGQDTLDKSVQVKPTSPRRVGVDETTDEFVVFDETGGNEYHGHVREWHELTQDMKNALIREGLVDRKGRIK
jgi:hypothetical protein